MKLTDIFSSDKPIMEMAYGGKNNERDDIWWHGSVSNDLRGGITGLHLGTKQAATEALTASIGHPARGTWDGKREYGKTLLAGKKRLNRMGPYNICGMNCDAPDHDYYISEHPRPPKYSNGEQMPWDVKPSIRPFKIVGTMTNSPNNPHKDWKANGYMKASIKKGNAKNGYYYKNEGEDTGSISAVVPNGTHVKVVPLKELTENLLEFKVEKLTVKGSNQYDEKEIKVFINPSYKELEKIIPKLANKGAFRGLLDSKGNFYVWDGYMATHDSVARSLGIGSPTRYFYLGRYKTELYFDCFHNSSWQEILQSDIKKYPNITRAVIPHTSLKEFKIEKASIGKSGKEITVFKNPNYNEMQDFYNRFSEIRGLLDDSGILYVWNAAEAIHSQAAEALGVRMVYRLYMIKPNKVVAYLPDVFDRAVIVNTPSKEFLQKFPMLARAIQPRTIREAFESPERFAELAKRCSNVDEFIRKTDGMDVLYRGHYDEELNDNSFMTDWVGHAEQYAGGSGGKGKIDAFAYDPNDVLYFDDAKFELMRNSIKRLSDKRLEAVYKAALVGNRHADYLMDDFHLVKEVLRGNRPYSKISDSPHLNDPIVPLLQAYAREKGKNIIAFNGSDYADYGGQTEYVVGSVSKLINLRELYTKIKNNDLTEA